MSEELSAENRARIVILGAGHGGVELCASLRQGGHQGEIVLLSDEPDLPYQRPPLSKEYLKRPDMLLALRPEAFFRDNRIDLRCGLRAQSLDRVAKELSLSDGTRLHYDQLVFATGARNIMPPIEGLAEQSPLQLRSLADARNVAELLPQLRSLVVIGAGFIGLEAAALLREFGCEIDVIDIAPRVMARAVTPETSHWFEVFHRQRGVRLHLNSGIQSVQRHGAGVEVTLSDGRQLRADGILLAAGVRANDDLAQAAGLECRNGIVMDATLGTTDPAIFALGDVALFPQGQGHIRLESVQNAVDQARYLAQRLLSSGSHGPYDALPWFWSNQAEARLQIAGVSAGIAPAALHVVRRQISDQKFAHYVFTDDILVTVETLNMPADHMLARKLLTRQSRPSRGMLEAYGFDLKAVLADQALQSDAAE